MNRTYKLTTPDGHEVCDVSFGDSFIRVAGTEFGVADSGILRNLEGFIQEKNYKEFDAHDPEILPFFCRECGRLYASEDWIKTPIFEEDGWLDQVKGICPNGHQRMMQD